MKFVIRRFSSHASAAAGKSLAEAKGRRSGMMAARAVIMPLLAAVTLSLTTGWTAGPATAQPAGAQPTPPAPASPPGAGQPQPASPAAVAPQQDLVLVVLGDSLSAGYNLPGNKAFPAVLEEALRASGRKVKVVNAGVSGDTTTGGLDRLDWSIPDNASGVIVELGANDMLRGVDPAIPRNALNQIISRLQQRKIPVMLAGMRAAPNLGGRYAEEFEGIFKDLSGRYNLVLYPFFLDGVAGERNLLLDDGMHPNPEGVKVMVRNILPAVEQFISTLPGQ